MRTIRTGFCSPFLEFLMSARFLLFRSVLSSTFSLLFIHYLFVSGLIFFVVLLFFFFLFFILFLWGSFLTLWFLIMRTLYCIRDIIFTLYFIWVFFLFLTLMLFMVTRWTRRTIKLKNVACAYLRSFLLFWDKVPNFSFLRRRLLFSPASVVASFRSSLLSWCLLVSWRDTFVWTQHPFKCSSVLFVYLQRMSSWISPSRLITFSLGMWRNLALRKWYAWVSTFKMPGWRLERVLETIE